MEEGKGLDTITISIEEYKGLLITKGKYEELKSQEEKRKLQNVWATKQSILNRDFPQYYDPSKTTIACEEKGL